MPTEAKAVDVTAAVITRLQEIQGGNYWTDHGGRVYAGNRDKIYHDDATALPYCVLLSETESSQTDEFGAGGGDHVRSHTYSLVWRVSGEGDFQTAMQRALFDTRIALARENIEELHANVSTVEISSAFFDPPAQSSGIAKLTISLAISYTEIIRRT